MSSTDGHRGRGTLHVLLGAAPGVGKTVAMLEEGHRLREAGSDVVVALVETHGRTATAAALGDLTLVPRLTVGHRGVTLSELDVDAVIARAPDVALVDELAHSNAPGSPRAKRYEDVALLLDAGIDVLTTVNIQHIDSLNGVVEQITGVAQRETVPDAVLRGADQVELVDVAPPTLQGRLAQGKVYPAERVDAALSNYFRLGNLTALRELALLWLADEVDSSLRSYRDAHAISSTWQARERVVVALTGGAEGETLLRRGARIAARTAGGELLAVHAIAADGLRSASPGTLAEQRTLVESLGGSFHQVVAENVASALVEFARGVNATQLVIGLSRRGRLRSILGGPGVGRTVIGEAGSIDVHIVNHDAAGGGLRLPRPARGVGGLSGGLTARRRLLGLAVSLLGGPLLTWAMIGWRSPESIIGDVLLYQLLVIVVALVGGLWPALLTAVLSGMTLDFFFIEPFHTITVAEPLHVLALALYVVNAILVSYVVDTAARRSRTAQRAAAESELLAGVAGSVLRGQDALEAILGRTREAFGLAAVRVVVDGEVLAASPARGTGTAATATAEVATAEVAVGERGVLEVVGRVPTPSERRLLGVIAAQVDVALEHTDLERTARSLAPLAETDRVRSALLSAVSHDLRRPLAAAVTAVGALRSTDVAWSEADRRELLATADESLGTLTSLVTDLLDVTRLEAGVLAVATAPTYPGDVVVAALDELGLGPGDVELDLALPAVPLLADPALLQRVVVNLLSNAVRHHGAAAGAVRITTSLLGETGQIRVIDRGPGIPPSQRERVFVPFQRLGDTDNATGLGLGLALSQGFVEGMGGTLEVEDTPGGGVTMVVGLAVADRSSNQEHA
ncbi:histidine kinase [Serinibacter arcticus]|uniref:histidine kinase n=1 Tax=Serinibacter arcticus TaxID=1655435 RepID=A0A2U1ZWQ6_9MICO|nr:ATP-binding protein [Serinibacter arcticus]PWD51411.1 histidine kinase [Serinibacter arcticus]